MPRLVATVLAGLVLALSGLVLPSPAVAACTCTEASLPEQAARASQVLLGSVRGSSRGTETIRYDVRVSRVFKGQRAARLRLRTPIAVDACSLRLRTDAAYVVFGTAQGDVVEVNRCGGTAPRSAGLLREVRAVLGEGTPAPAPSGSPSGSPGGPPGGSPGSSPGSSPASAPTQASLTRLEDAEPTDFTRLAAPGAAAVIVGLLGLLVLSRVGRTR